MGHCHTSGTNTEMLAIRACSLHRVPRLVPDALVCPRTPSCLLLAVTAPQMAFVSDDGLGRCERPPSILWALPQSGTPSPNMETGPRVWEEAPVVGRPSRHRSRAHAPSVASPRPSHACPASAGQLLISLLNTGVCSSGDFCTGRRRVWIRAVDF